LKPLIFALLTVLVNVAAASTQEVLRVPCGVSVPAEEGIGFVAIPRGTLFCPIIADPKEARSFVTLQRGSRDPIDTDIAAVGLSDSFGIIRWGGPRVGEGLQLGVAGSIFAQFDLATPSYDLINADYILGLLAAYRRGGVSARLGLQHQSSHLGDEYLLRDEDLERENLSFESVKLLLSGELAGLRVYAGAESLFGREPADLASMVAQAGLEVRQLAPAVRIGNLGAARLLDGVDLKATDDQDWSPAVSVRAGLETGRARVVDEPSRRWQLLAEFYDGPTPYGQFFRDNIRFVGVGIHFSL
jgi:hypothetical protein